jgi:formylglycine-generating enzyme required for sulfatase activity
VKIQEDFVQGGDILIKKLQDYVDSCEAVIILVGELLGFVPNEVERSSLDNKDWSYTQWEYHFSRGYRLGKGIVASPKDAYLYFARDDFYSSERFPQTEQEICQQRAHKEEILSSGLDYNEFSSIDELCRWVLRSGFQLQERRAKQHEREQYLKHLSNEFSRVKFDTLTFVGEKTGRSMDVNSAPISEVFVQPMVRRVSEFGETVSDYQLSDVERDIVSSVRASEKAIVVIGPPGAGKTTSLQWLVVSLAKQNLAGESHLIPLFLDAKDLNTNKIESVDDLIRVGVERWKDTLSIGETLSWINAERQHLLFVIDALDEVNLEYCNVPKILSSLNSLKSINPYQRLVVSSRAQDYHHDQRFQLVGSEALLIPELTVQKVHQVIRAWQQCRKNTDGMISALGSSAQLASFSTNPRCLELFQLASTVSGVAHDIPEIIDAALDVLLFSEKSLEKTKISIDDIVELGQESTWRTLCLNTLSLIAAQCLDTHSGQGSVQFSRSQLATAVYEEKAISNEANDQDYKYRGAALEHLRRGHGVLIDLNQESFLFSQDAFRDVLAAKYLASLSETEFIRRAKRREWFQAFKYFAISLSKTYDDKLRALHLARKMFRCQKKSNNHQLLMVVGEFFAAQVDRYEIFDGPMEFQADYEVVRDTIGRYVLNPTVGNDHNRLEAGVLLGRIGDLRVPSEHCTNQPLSELFAEVPQGTYNIGGRVSMDVDHPKYDPVQSKNELVYTSKGFLIAKNLVTNLEFGKFIFDDGYKKEQFWDDGLAANWARQDSATIELLVDEISNSADLHLHTNMSMGRLTKEEVRDTLRTMVERTEPLFWYDRRYNTPNQPVVGVNLWEAMAYARWCNFSPIFSELCSKYEFGIATEVEWEAAASQYYGEEDSRTTCYWNRLPEFGSRTAPVGLFPISMRVKDGPFDLIGNTWEWTVSSQKDFSLSTDKSVDPIDMTDRFVRGGSWLSSKPMTHDRSFRSYDPPCNCYEDLGFRLVARERMTE